MAPTILLRYVLKMRIPYETTTHGSGSYGHTSDLQNQLQDGNPGWYSLCFLEHLLTAGAIPMPSFLSPS